ncbi:Terminal uridylyltransferase 4 [Geodia barretti]|uniref:Terminal uridylyltransferase 4 n=1 Tax=Geodia barretti TaxID=519541 RepID=A0AA35S3X2_GEOBA|nr:Terminal uridylyltransferase 4 [Geodia barretti]
MATEENKVRATTATSGDGSAGRGEREGADTSLSPELVMELKKDFIFPMKDAQPQLLKDCRVSIKDRQRKQLVCAACKKHMNNIKTAKSHIETKEHKIKLKEHELERFLPALPREYPAESLQSLTDFLTKTFQDHSAREQRETRFSVATELQGYLNEDGLDVTVSVFGSSASGFALKSSNVNLNVNFSTPTENPLVIARSMKGVAECLRNGGETYEDVEEDYFSFNRIPRILFQHKHSKLKCEIRIEAGNPAALCSLLKLYGEIDVRCVQLAVLFRLWARICGLDSQESGHYPGHMFVLMVIHFLQQINVLPILHELYKEKTGKSKKYSGKSGSGPTSPETKAPTPQHSTKPGDKDSSGGTDQEGVGEGEGDEDDIVVFEESETGRAAGGDEVEDDGAEKDAKEKVGERKQYKVDYFSLVSELSSQWETSNHQSLGELWLGLLMYYAIDFKVQEHAVSIRQKQSLLRKSRQWGDVRLAVEDPMVFNSNLGRGSTSNLVYSYLMGSLRLTALYFNVYSDPSSSTTLTESQSFRNNVKRDDTSSASISWNNTDCGGSRSSGGHEKTEVVRGEREGLGGSIEHQDSSIVSVSSSVLVASTRSQEDVHSPVDLTFLNKQPSEASGQQAAGDLHPCHESGCTHEVAPQTMPSDKACPTECVEDEFEGLAITAEGQISQKEADKEESTQISSSPKVLSSNEASTTAFQECDNDPCNSRKTLVFAREEFVFQEYPLACLNCKKLKHTILECPELDLASKYKEMLPDKYPSSFYLKCISSCFAENMRMELPDEADILMRQEILRSILADITGLYPCKLHIIYSI